MLAALFSSLILITRYDPGPLHHYGRAFLAQKCAFRPERPDKSGFVQRNEATKNKKTAK